MTEINSLHNQWMNDANYQQEYNKLAAEFDLATMLTLAREESGLSQLEIAKRMNTKQSVIARLESADGNPTLKTLSRYAEAIGGHLQISIAR